MVEEIRRSIIELKNLEQKVGYCLAETRNKQELLQEELEKNVQLKVENDSLKVQNEAYKKRIEDLELELKKALEKKEESGSGWEE